jgi:DNA polymerase-1
MPAKKIFLIDAMGFVFRAFYAPMPMRLRSQSGVPTNVPYLFSTMLRRLLKNWQPDYLAVVFDPPGPTFRDQLFADYKAQRPPMPEDLAVQLPYVRRLCEAMRLPVVEFPGFEADDAIGALAGQAAKKKLDVYIVTSDKDMLQLVRTGVRAGNILVLRPQSRAGTEDRLVDEKGVEEILGVPPAKVVDLMSLMGDSIDNIPGAKGIGEKGAIELIRRFGSVEAALERAAEVENKRYREALQQQKDRVLLSKQLAAISTDAPVPLELDSLTLREPDVEALRALYTELNFSSLLKELSVSAPPPAAVPADYATLDSPAALKEFLAAIAPGQEAALWIALAPPADPDEEPGYGCRVAAVEIATAPGTARTAWLDENGAMAAALLAWLADASRPKIVHDPKLAELLLGPVAGVRHATMLYSYLLRPTTAKHGLPDLALRHLGPQPSGAAGESADLLLRLAPVLRKEVDAQGLARVYEKIDLPLAPVLARMERAGVLVSPDALGAMSEAMENEIRSLEARIFELAGGEFNINSPAQLGEILFDKMGLEPPASLRGRGKTRGGARSTAAEVLEALAPMHEIAQRVLEFREISKLKSTYADALPRLIHPQTGRIHTRLSQTGTATGRLASSNPNLQNIPVRTELGRQIRAAFVAPPGCVLLSADYSQIELRILAHVTGDEVLCDAFRRGEDIHARTAQEVFGVGPLMQTPEHRRMAKVINFGIIYGLSAFGLAQQLGIEQKEAAEFINAYFARYRGVKAWLDNNLAEVRTRGFTRTLFGRTRPIPEINSPQPAMRSFAERTALNSPIQGAAADLIKLAMIEIDRLLAGASIGSPSASRVVEDGGLKAAPAKSVPAARMILQVHDELLFEAREDSVEALRGLVQPAMESVRPFDGPLAVPLVADIKVGPNWRDMK